ncbi:tetratricopeptide repeat protein [Phyllobacterium sp. SB3]|uniref:tetratricopeptide repeat protein n=1 Tax=Phyllobacterium sp. SB3 TaxID=3156073 RepID=UPI0032AF29EC
MTGPAFIQRKCSFIFSVALIALTTGISGCSTTDKTTTGSISPATSESPALPAGNFDQMNEQQLMQASTSLGNRYQSNPKDKTAAVNYATVLRMTNRSDQALAVMRSLAIAYPKDRSVLAAYGKALASSGEFEAALDSLRRAQTPEYPDWRLLSAEGAILDQLGKTSEARDLYRKALQVKPDEASIYSNMGMSYVLSGELNTAEEYLRKAVVSSGADSRVRQNLALVVGLQGRFDEAEKIASQELSPQQARTNVKYLRSMLSQQNSWNMLKDKKPKG